MSLVHCDLHGHGYIYCSPRELKCLVHGHSASATPIVSAMRVNFKEGGGGCAELYMKILSVSCSQCQEAEAVAPQRLHRFDAVESDVSTAFMFDGGNTQEVEAFKGTSCHPSGASGCCRE